MSGVDEPTHKRAWFSNKEWLVLAVALSVALAGTVVGALAPRSTAPSTATAQTVIEPNPSESVVATESATLFTDKTTSSQPTTETASKTTTSTSSNSANKKTEAKKQLTPKQKAKQKTKPQTGTPVTTPSNTSVASLRLTVAYGNYQGTPLVWRVLGVKKSEILLISDAVLTSGAWRSDWENGGANVYKESSVRAWLNGDFLTTSFTAAEANACMKRMLPGGLKDKVFLLNQQEVTNYFATSALRTAAPLAWASAHTGYSGEDLTVTKGKAAWWLLDSEKKSDWEAHIVRSDGKFDKAPVYYGDIGLRPAIVLDRASVNLSLTVPTP